MPATFQILPIPSGSQLTQTIGADDPDDLNDFRALIVADQNVTGLAEADITLSTGYSLQSFEGQNSVHAITIRPPETAGMLTITIAANSVSEGNALTTQDIRISTRFPDDDAEAPTSLFAQSGFAGITVTPTHIALLNQYTLGIFQHDGTSIETRTLDSSLSIRRRSPIDFINGDYLIQQGQLVGSNVIRVRDSDLSLVRSYVFSTPASNEEVGIAHTPRGIIRSGSNSTSSVSLQPYDSEGSADRITLTTDDDFRHVIAHQNDLIYAMYGRNLVCYLVRLEDSAALETIIPINIVRPPVTSFDRDAAIYRDTLYILNEDGVYTIDIRKYRLLATNTKTTIYPVFANEGDTIPLSQYCPDAKTLTFATGFDKPTYLSINASNELEIASNAVTETTPVLVKLTGINYIDSANFSFYLIIVQASAPEWRNVESLSMKANTTYDLHQIVDADSIAFESGETQPTGSSLSDGVFTIATTAGTAYFRATKDGLTTDKSIQIDVIQKSNPDNFSDIFRFKVEIAGIDITSDLLPKPPLRITKSLDNIELSKYRAGSVSIRLRNNEGKYNPDLTDNFWEANNLNPGGYQESIKIYRESFINGLWLSTLLFVGIIENQRERFSAAQANITAKDISVELERSFISNFGTLSKWASLRQKSDKATYEGVYLSENSLTPIQPKSGKAWSHKTPLILRQLQNPNKGPSLPNTGYLSSTDFRTSGGFLNDPPILNFKTVPQSENVSCLIKQLALEGAIYNTDIQLIDIRLDGPTVFNRGSVPFSVENTRITRLPIDWVHDSTNNRVMNLLSNPESHVADLVVQYSLDSDSYRSLHTFDTDISVHRIARRTSTDYYILSAKAIAQDRSAASLPRTADSTGYAYDSITEGSEIKILRYNASTDTLTEHVGETDDHPPQLGIHYHVGFENALYIDEFEGVTSDYRGAFKVIGSDLYYRYAKDGEFGVATADASGTTASVISETTLNYHNHLNFAFDVLATGTVYFVYSGGGSDFDEVSVASANHYTGTLTIADDLSSYTQPLSIQATIVVVSGGGTHGTLQIIGLDENGQTQTVSLPFSDTPQTTTRVFPNPFTRITSATLTSNTTVFSVRISTIPTSTSSLTIKRISGGTVTTIFTETPDLDALTALDDGGGAYLGCHEALFHDDALYMLCPIQRVDSDDASPPVYTRSQANAAGMVLFSCDVTAGTPTLTVIETWDFVTHSACNLIVHDGAVHYTEQPSAAEKFLPINSSL